MYVLAKREQLVTSTDAVANHVLKNWAENSDEPKEKMWVILHRVQRDKQAQDSKDREAA